VKKKVVIGFLGTQLDSGRGSARWEKWRPSVALTQYEDLVVHRLELLHMPLLFVPYRPVRNEWMILSGRKILADQMAWLRATLPANSRHHDSWLAKMKAAA